MRLLRAQFLVLSSTSGFPETFSTELAWMILLFHVHSFQMPLRSSFVDQKLTAPATHPATVVHHSKAVLDCLQAIFRGQYHKVSNNELADIQVDCMFKETRYVNLHPTLNLKALNT